MMQTLKHIDNEFRTFANGHAQINDYFWGVPVRAINEKKLKYPCIIAYPIPTGTISKNSATISLDIIIVDRVRKDMANQLDVENQTQLICKELFNFVNRNQNINLATETATLTPIADDFKDEVWGWRINLAIQLQQPTGNCLKP